MAIIRLDCNLNGGDSVTPNNELFYRIYGDLDGYSSPIHTTGTALSDANVTVNNDNVIITGVDGATNISFKIAAVDAAFNEGILSDAISSIVLFQDNFAGTVTDITNKWNYFDNGTGGTEFSQNNNIISTRLATLVASDSVPSYYETKNVDMPYDAYSVLVFDLWGDFIGNPILSVGMFGPNLDTDPKADGIYLNSVWTDTITMRIAIYINEVLTYEDFTVPDNGVRCTYKIISNDGGAGNFTTHYWNDVTDEWDLKATMSGAGWGSTDNVRPAIYTKQNIGYGTEGAESFVDNFYLLDSDIQTRYP